MIPLAIQITPELLTWLGAILTGLGGGWAAYRGLKRSRKEGLADCERRLKAYAEEMEELHRIRMQRMKEDLGYLEGRE